MIIPENFEQKIGFFFIRDQIASGCQSEQGKAMASNIRFLKDKNSIEKFCLQTMQFKDLMQRDENLPSLSLTSQEQNLERIRIEGTLLDGKTYKDLLSGIRAFGAYQDFLKKNQEEFSSLHAFFDHISFQKHLIKNVENTIDDEGEVRNDASPELQRIRHDLMVAEQKVRKTLEKIAHSSRKNKLSPEDASLTVRNGRLVIPIKSEHKRTFKGFIHDESSTGSIAYMEPAEVLEINNEIKDLQYAEKREIIKILTQLTDSFRPHISEILTYYTILARLDLIQSKAKFSAKFECIFPEITTNKSMDWINARHPVLQNSLEKQEKSIVPLNIHLDHENRILVISGPNAGGKSVCIKTVGLLQYMFQCGFPIPVGEGSKCTIFNDIFLDIGDEQSIENDLSTYSSHLTYMKKFQHYAGKKSLFIIDEFGTGTDPQFGGAIAESILEELNQSGAYGLVTTHYANLKKMADKIDGIINGRMRFDVTRLEPLYQLEIGKPGSSFAMEIARKIGLAGKTLDKAKKKAGYDQVKFDRLLNELEVEKSHYEELNKKLDQKENLLETTLNNYKELNERVKSEKKEVLNRAKKEALQIIADANKTIEKTIHDIKSNQAEKKKTKEVRENLKGFEKDLKAKLEIEEPQYEIVKGAISKGDWVKLKDGTSVGEVLNINKKDAEVIFNGLKTRIKLNRLEKISKKQARQESRAQSYSHLNINQRKSHFNTDLDLRGKRAEEATLDIQKFLDDAILFTVPSVRIIHGKGDGVLREIVRNEARTYKEITSIADEHADRGGAGISIIHFD